MKTVNMVITSLLIINLSIKPGGHKLYLLPVATISAPATNFKIRHARYVYLVVVTKDNSSLCTELVWQ